MTKDLKGDRWTCPSDRNLQLRSKLNAGWSYHTGKKVLKKDSQLTESELLEIQKVIQRSEMLERAEKDRVVKLVERLENMKKNALRSGFTSPNRCAICGEHFYLLRSIPNECNFCKKILCSKCIIDKQCNTDDSASSKNASRRGSVTSLTYSQFKVIYLCRLCSEQREFLKKSGAWFRSNSLSGNDFSDMLTRNHTTLSSSSSNLNKFWKPKEFFHYFDDNFSNENEFKNDSINYETQNGLSMNRLKSNENLSTGNNLSSISCKSNLNSSNNNNNLVVKTPLSPSKKQEIFTFSSTLFNTSSNNNSPASLNSLKSSSKLINESGIDDDAYDSPSMSSYNYYSNIINNLTTESSLNLKGEEENSKTKNNCNVSQLKTSKASNGLLSVSTSNLANDQYNNINIKPNGSLNSKTDLLKSIRKPKIIEWCSTQMSMEKDDLYVNQAKKNKSIEKQNKTSINNSSNNQSAGKTYNLSNGTKPKLSFQSVNNLAKKISNQNNGIVETNSVAASSSKAVSSASSLTASLNKLNFL